METRVNYCPNSSMEVDIRSFVQEGIQDVINNELFDFDTTFDELEERYGADG